LPSGSVQFVQAVPGAPIRAFLGGGWFEWRAGRWAESAELTGGGEEFVFADSAGKPIRVAIPWREVRQLVTVGRTNLIVTENDVAAVTEGQLSALGWQRRAVIRQVALSPSGDLTVASEKGLFQRSGDIWQRLTVLDQGGRAWTE